MCKNLIFHTMFSWTHQSLEKFRRYIHCQWHN